MDRSYIIQPILLAGGSGSRLWPLSRESFPKQYLKLSSSSKFSCLQKTQNRLLGLPNIENPILICNEEHRFIAAEQMREINIEPKSIILESEGKNTAPAIAIAALKAVEDNNDPILLILSSDHEIKNTKKFKDAISLGLPEAIADALVIFGVKPTSPECGYGYIEVNEKINFESSRPISIKSFREKPSEQKAKDYLKKGNYLWNSGIFLFKASTILRELSNNMPELVDLCKKSLDNDKDFDFQRLNTYFFKKCPNISIDCAILEKTKKAKVIPFDVGWNDIGNWQALWDIENKDKNGNAIIGDIKFRDIENCYLNSTNKLLVAIGIKDLIVVQTKDTTLVIHRKDAQKIKEIVSKLKLEGRPESITNKTIFRPWGYFNSIEESPNWKVKEIFVNPNSSLSLQKHLHRSEHWIILEGKASIQINDSKKELIANESTFIPKGAKHRLSNKENSPLIIIEIQCGTYLGEDDIIRFEDNYGR